jgi:hypothetical protein
MPKNVTPEIGAPPDDRRRHGTDYDVRGETGTWVLVVARFGSNRHCGGSHIARRADHRGGVAYIGADRLLCSPIEHITPKSDHLVVCEQGEDLSEVIAANYAFALGAGLHLIPQTADPVAEDILERFYSVMDQTRMAATDALTELKAKLRDRCGPIAIPPGGSITFVTRRLPYGFAFPEVPSTHLFAYPDLGISIINGFSAEQPEAAGVGVAVLVDPGAPKLPTLTRLSGCCHQGACWCEPTRPKTPICAPLPI